MSIYQTRKLTSKQTLLANYLIKLHLGHCLLDRKLVYYVKNE